MPALLTEEQYAERIAAIQEWIRAGDVYQLNFTVPYSVRVRGSEQPCMRGCANGSQWSMGPFFTGQRGGGFFHFRRSYFSAWMGTRWAADHDQADEGDCGAGADDTRRPRTAEWLRNDAKNRSENVMIVDLLRNDLGRLAKFGSVRAENLFAVERYPTLWQMTSTVKRGIAAGGGLPRDFRALFPCGSMTGAPKVRAMQLLAELEDEPRGVYTGAIGYFSRGRRCSTWRFARWNWTASGGDGRGQRHRDRFRSRRGVRGMPSEGGVSDGGGKWRSGAVFADRDDAVGGGYPLMEMHLDRLMDSAEYFGFACERDAVKAALDGVCARI